MHRHPHCAAAYNSDQNALTAIELKRSNFNWSNEIVKACETNNYWWISNILKTTSSDHATIVNTSFEDDGKKRIDIDVCDADGWSGLHWASRNNNDLIVTSLLRAGSDINKTTPMGHTPLNLAALYGSNSSALLLLQVAGCDVNTRSHDGNTPLMHASRFNHTSLVTSLLAAGADTHHRNPRGDDCLSLACRNGHHAVVKLLVNAGAVSDNVDRAVASCRDESTRRALLCCRDDATRGVLLREYRWFLRKSFLVTLVQGGLISPFWEERGGGRDLHATQSSGDKAEQPPASAQELVFCNLYREIAHFI